MEHCSVERKATEKCQNKKTKEKNTEEIAQLIANNRILFSFN